MPELPEVEVTRNSFASRIQNARILRVRAGKPLRWPLGCAPQALISRRFETVTRRGKYLWLALDEGGLLIHLGMSGALSFSTSPAPEGPHDHFDLVTTQGTLRLTDPRRFGAVVWSASMNDGAAGKLLARLGLEPFDAAFTGDYLYAALRARHLSIKQALLGGNIVVGAGNIYACEALFAAAIDPRTHSNALSLSQCAALATAVRRILRAAIDLGGSSLRDFRDTHGLLGQFQDQAQVYGRAGQACTRCHGTVCRIIQAQRATFFCPSCQRG